MDCAIENRCTKTLRGTQLTRKQEKTVYDHVFHADFRRFNANNVNFNCCFTLLGKLLTFEHNQLCQMSFERVELASPQLNAGGFN